MATRVRTDYEKALRFWVMAAIGDSYKAVLGPRKGPKPKVASDTYVLIQSVRRALLGQPVKGTTTTPWPGGTGVIGGQAFTYRIRADLNVYGPHAAHLMDSIDGARWRPESLPKEKRLRIETIGNWQDLSSLEGPGHRTRFMAQITFQWVSVKNYEVTRTIESAEPIPNLN